MSRRTSVAIYEFITGGGWSASYADQPCPVSLLAEGKAMLSAVASDFARLADVETRVLYDQRMFPGLGFARCEMTAIDPDNEREQLQAAAARADWTLIIAPEFDLHLARRTTDARDAGGRMLNPSFVAVQTASDKNLLANYLKQARVPAPAGFPLFGPNQLPSPLPWPRAVLKPRFGAGSQDVHLLTRDGPAPVLESPAHLRIEEFVPGQAVSVAALCGPAGAFPLPACRQHLSQDGRFRYEGGSVPLEANLSARASRLALAALATLPDLVGYVGVDLVLGDDSLGSEDYVIEINPRLTTSYVGLRALSTTNLAQAMLDAAQGKAPLLAFHSGLIRFTSEGQITSG